MSRQTKILLLLCGSIGGFLNGLFGSGAGVVCVLFLRRILGDDKKAHATSTLLVLIMSCASLALYACFGEVDFSASLAFLPGGVAGAVLGALILKRIDSAKLKKLFGAVLAVSGVVMLLS